MAGGLLCSAAPPWCPPPWGGGQYPVGTINNVLVKAQLISCPVIINKDQGLDVFLNDRIDRSDLLKKYCYRT